MTGACRLVGPPQGGAAGDGGTKGLAGWGGGLPEGFSTECPEGEAVFGHTEVAAASVADSAASSLLVFASARKEKKKDLLVTSLTFLTLSDRKQIFFF